MTKAKTYNSESSALNAARKAGHEIDDVEIVQDGAKFSFKVKEAVTNEVAASLAAMGETVVRLDDAKGEGDYGMCRADEAYETASKLADADLGAVEIRLPADNSLIATINPAAKLATDTIDWGSNDTTTGAAVEPVALHVSPEIAEAFGMGDMVESGLVVVEHPDSAVEPMALNGGPSDCEQVAYGEAAAANAGVPAQRPVVVPIRVDLTETIAKLVALHDEAVATGLEQVIPTALVADVIGFLKGIKVPRAPKAATGDGPAKSARVLKTAPEGKYAEIIRLCCRETGASPAELIEATGWTKAPWKWLLNNPKDGGLCKRYGYDFVVSKDGRAARYLLTKVVPSSESEAGTVAEGEGSSGQEDDDKIAA